MHVYIVLTFFILVHIPTTIFTLNPHSELLKNGKSSCSGYMDRTLYKTKLYAYTIDH